MYSCFSKEEIMYPGIYSYFSKQGKKYVQEYIAVFQKETRYPRSLLQQKIG
jgi:hypothetical protein